MREHFPTQDHSRYTDLMKSNLNLNPEMLTAYGRAKQLERAYEKAFALLPETRSYSDETNSVVVVLTTPATVAQILLDQDWRDYISDEQLGTVISQTVANGFTDMYMETAQYLDKQEISSEPIEEAEIEDMLARKKDELLAAANYTLPPRDNEVFFSAIDETLSHADRLLKKLSGPEDAMTECEADEHRHIVVRGYGTLHPEFILDANWISNAPTATILAKLDSLLRKVQRTAGQQPSSNPHTNNPEDLAIQAIAAINRMKEQI